MSATLRVGVVPAPEHARRPRLWAALEEAYPVRFEGRAPGAVRDLDALVAIDTTSGVPAEDLATAGLLLGARGLPCLFAARGEERPDAENEPLSESVGYASIQTRALFCKTTEPRSSRASAARRVACIPEELAEGEALRERLRPGRHRALLTLACFLRSLTDAGPAPPLHAAFVIDDPNLRRPRYGHIDYAQLLAHARAHGFHVSIATVPLDARLADPRAVSLFREGAEHLSLCVHGNDHDGPELGRPRSDAQSLALVAQALRRTAAFERRTGLAVERVMVPPHERLAEPVARALRACAFQAICTTRPYPWLASTPSDPWLARPPQAGPLAAWSPIGRVAGGLPVLLRADFEHPREDLALRAFLGQPLILYGHHDLLAGGPDRLAQTAAQIERLGDVRWSSLASIARAYAPEGAADSAGAHAAEGAALDAAGLAAIPSPPRRPRPLLRRLASEARDRASALGRPGLSRRQARPG
jgi:hypothetical protein